MVTNIRYIWFTGLNKGGSVSKEDIQLLSLVGKSTIWSRSQFSTALLCLPDRVAIVAVYGLLGIFPIEQELDIRKLSLFATVMFDEASLEHEIAQRQFAVKDITSNSDSWFIQCNLLLHKYGLPNAYLIKDSFQTKWALKEAISRGGGG